MTDNSLKFMFGMKKTVFDPSSAKWFKKEKIIMQYSQKLPNQKHEVSNQVFRRCQRVVEYMQIWTLNSSQHMSAAVGLGRSYTCSCTLTETYHIAHALFLVVKFLEKGLQVEIFAIKSGCIQSYRPYSSVSIKQANTISPVGIPFFAG